MSTRTKKKKTIRYPEAPSGMVTFYNYKEPFMEYEAGFGFQGVLLMDASTGEVQCHPCGEWMDAINSRHLRGRHGITASEYKVEVGLNQNTALISEQHRDKLVRTGQARFKNLKKGGKKTKAQIAAITAGLKAYQASMEAKNNQATCPAQLIDRLKKLATELGRTPTVAECKFFPTLLKVFGTWKEACLRAGLKHRTTGRNVHYVAKGKFEYNKEVMLKMLRDFKERWDRPPSKSDLTRHLLPSSCKFAKVFGSFRLAKKEAFAKV